MLTISLFCRLFVILNFCVVLAAKAERPRISEDRDLLDIDLTGWDCLDRLEGTARTEDAVERNRMKNRSAIDLSGVQTVTIDNAAFLKYVADFDAQTKGKRRKDLTPALRAELDALEKQIVSLSGWLVLAYAGPPETTNCGSTDFHDWHLELYQNSSNHEPRIGDPTPIICEITPRTQRAIYRDNIRVQALAGFFRRPDLSVEPTGHPARKIRVTGYLTWDDEHNGAADVGTTIRTIGANKYHQPWRTTAWEVHPVMKVEAITENQLPELHLPVTPVPSPANDKVPAVTTTPAPDQLVTITQPVKIKIPYGETVLPRGLKLPLVSRDAQSVVVKYMNSTQTIPISSTDLR